jgi:hypothetical protein
MGSKRKTGNGCNDHRDPEDSPERVDPSNDFVGGPSNERHIGQDVSQIVRRTPGMKYVDEEGQHDEDRKRNIWPLSDCQPSGPAVGQHPTNGTTTRTTLGIGCLCRRHVPTMPDSGGRNAAGRCEHRAIVETGVWPLRGSDACPPARMVTWCPRKPVRMAASLSGTLLSGCRHLAQDHGRR